MVNRKVIAALAVIFTILGIFNLIAGDYLGVLTNILLASAFFISFKYPVIRGEDVSLNPIRRFLPIVLTGLALILVLIRIFLNFS